MQDNLKNAIIAATKYIKNAILPSGRFIYKRHINPDIKFSKKKYNILRHIGTIYAMQLHDKYINLNSPVVEIEKTTEYLINNYIKQIDNNRWVVVSKKKEEGCKHIAKLGASGLALVVLCEYYKKYPGKSDQYVIGRLCGLGDFILSMQKYDGSFYSKFNTKKKKVVEGFNSLYYPGEAALGLIHLFKLSHQDKYLCAAERALLYLAKRNLLTKDKFPFDHWAIIAISEIFAICNPEYYDAYSDFISKMCNMIIDKQVKDEYFAYCDYCGAFHNNPKPCSIGTIVEGLVAAYKVYKHLDISTLQIEHAINRGVKFLIKSQLITVNDLNGGIPTNINWSIKLNNKKAGTIRIDNVQHVLSAWITILSVIKN